MPKESVVLMTVEKFVPNPQYRVDTTLSVPVYTQNLSCPLHFTRILVC